jgi:hypothetical protein
LFSVATAGNSPEWYQIHFLNFVLFIIFIYIIVNSVTNIYAISFFFLLYFSYFPLVYLYLLIFFYKILYKIKILTFMTSSSTLSEFVIYIVILREVAYTFDRVHKRPCTVKEHGQM